MHPAITPDLKYLQTAAIFYHEKVTSPCFSAVDCSGPDKMVDEDGISLLTVCLLFRLFLNDTCIIILMEGWEILGAEHCTATTANC